MLAAALICLAPLCQDPDAPLYAVEDAFPAQEKFDKPLYLDHHASDPEVYYVVEQDGAVWRIPRDGAKGDRHQFLDWSERCHRENWEEGLLGFAFDPGYPERNYLYIYWSKGLPKGKRQSVISRLEVDHGGDAPVAQPDTELVLMQIPQPFGNHNGGTIVFGPDEMLYVALGDGGAARDPHENGQDLSSLLGTVLRVDVRSATEQEPYVVPDDNPFVGVEGARGEIWAYGLRNPWRISFDRETGDLWCGDVGQNALEEVDRIVRGGNYGWNFMEGAEEFDRRKGDDPIPEGLIGPVAEYGRQQGLSITGGYVYRGTQLADLVGRYVYGDFGSSRMWAVRETDDGGDIVELCRAPGPIASFAEEPNGEHLVLCFDGRIYRLAAAKAK